jgi:DNA-binding transcriptional ArsR family regulator
MQTVFRAISDPTRRQILGLLADQAMTIGEVTGHFDMTRPAIAKHLHILEEGDLIRVEVRGRERLNHLNPEPLKNVADWIAIFDRFWDEKLENLKNTLEQNDDGQN